jgi:hypothetical protein
MPPACAAPAATAGRTETQRGRLRGLLPQGAALPLLAGEDHAPGRLLASTLWRCRAGPLRPLLAVQRRIMPVLGA